ncbi:A24 family peptidase [Neobacillus sp. Marseille-QA0830]
MEFIVLFLTLGICLVTDIKSRKILNIVTLPTILFALIYSIFTNGLEGFLFSGKGLLVGFIFLFIPYLLGGMGAGDVKLMAAIGALMGTEFVFNSFIFTALIGGAIGLFLIIKKNGFITLIKSIYLNIVYFRNNIGSIILSKAKDGRSISFPYGIAIVFGTLCSVVWSRF